MFYLFLGETKFIQQAIVLQTCKRKFETGLDILVVSISNLKKKHFPSFPGVISLRVLIDKLDGLSILYTSP